MANLIQQDYKEIDNFWNTDSLDTDYWTVASSGSGWTRSATYNNGTIRVFGRVAGSKNSGTITATNKIDLRNYGNKFMFTIGLKASEYSRSTNAASITGTVTLGSTVLLTSTTGGYTAQNPDKTTGGYVTFWITIEGDNMNIKRQFLNNTGGSFVGSFTPIADDTNVNISAISTLTLELKINGTTGSSSSIWAESTMDLSPIIYTKNTMGSNKTL